MRRVDLIERIRLPFATREISVEIRTRARLLARRVSRRQRHSSTAAYRHQLSFRRGYGARWQFQDDAQSLLGEQSAPLHTAENNGGRLRLLSVRAAAAAERRRLINWRVCLRICLNRAAAPPRGE